MDYSSKFKEIRGILNLSQEQFAAKLNISFSSYRRIESSSVSTIQTSVMDALFYQCNISPLFFYYDIQPIFTFELQGKIKNQLMLHDVKKKIKNIFEINFLEILLQSADDQYYILLQSLQKIKTQNVKVTEAKDLIISTIQESPVGLEDLNMRVFTTQRSKKKLLDFVNSLEEIECFVILHNIDEVIKTIKDSSLLL